MNEHIASIRELIGELADALFRRASLPGVSFLEVISRENYQPESDEERTIWTKLTAPSNHAHLLEYVEYWKSQGTDLFADTLHRAILLESNRRWERGDGPSTS